MSLPVNIESLLSKQKVESSRVEYKRGWNPISIYHSICAFANDIDDLGGGYILVGVEEEHGVARRPVVGIPSETIDDIQKSMIGFNNLFEPYYMPRVSVEEIDKKLILVIWAPAGVSRPYSIPADVTSKIKKNTYYVRNGASSIVAKGEVLDELRELSSRLTFDMRGNPEIKIEDIDAFAIKNYLTKAKSKLLTENTDVEEILDRMDLMIGPAEHRMIRNVAAMMFCDHPYKFFPFTQVDVVTFAEGREKNPNNFVEVSFRGDAPSMIRKVMDYLSSHVIVERVVKPKDAIESRRFVNYPYQALEEAVVNAIYHRNYQESQSVEITIEPDRISILNFGGPDRSIQDADLKRGKILRSRRYRNPQLGVFLKELDLTEGRATGIPTIQSELAKNGSPAATISTNDERSFFLIDIPVHPDFKRDVSQNVPQNVPQSMPGLTERQQRIVRMAKMNPTISREEMASELGVTIKTVGRDIAGIRKVTKMNFVGSAKDGHWEL